MEFDWDEDKRLINKEKHGIDFDDLDAVFLDERSVIFGSPRFDEERMALVGLFEDRFITVIYVRRSNLIRIISARSARKEEKMQWLKSVSKHS